MSLLSVDEAIARIVAGVAPLETQTVALEDAAGRVLAEPLAAQRTQPPFPASAMDGYAVRSADIASPPTRLKLIGMAAAGHGFRGSIGPGEAVRIFTGAPVPDGADAILIQENAEAADGGAVVARETVSKGRHVRPAGQDFSQGAVLIEPGRRLAMREIALAAAMGFAEVPARRRPRMAILATGDELVPPGALPGPDQIVASNALAVAAYARSLGAEATDLGIAPDDRSAIAKAADAALALPADVLVTLGGASVGDHDLVREALADRGMELGFWRIAMRPGKPLMFGRIAGPRGRTMRVLGLPGNPVSSAVCAILFLKPLVEALLGLPPTDPTEPAVLGADIAANDARQDYLRATMTEPPGGPPVAIALPVQDSAMLSVLARADCLLIRPPDAPAANAGAQCRIIRLS